MGWNGCASHRKTRKLRCIRRKQGREGTSHWLSSSRTAWTRTVLPVRRATEDENERARTRAGDGWVEAGRCCSSRNIGAENYSGCGCCHLTDVRIYLRNRFQKWIGHGQRRLNASSLPHLSGVRGNRREGTFYSSSRLVKLDIVRTAASSN